jgi:hypothetical protein
MFAAPLSYLPNSEPKWNPEMPPSADRACVVCGATTLNKRSKYCFTHYQESPTAKKLAAKKETLANLESRPEAQQPKSAIVSITNEIRRLEQEKEPSSPGSFCPGTGSWDPEEPVPEEPAEDPSAGSHQGRTESVAEEAGEPPEPATEPSGLSDGVSDGNPPGEPEEPPEPATEPSGLSDGVSGGDPPISRELARQMRQEVETGKSARGRALSEEEIRLRLAKLQRRVVFLPLRFRQTELSRINELERRFVGHLADVANTICDHTTAALEPLVARAEGRLPPMREGQTIAQRKTELDLAMVSLRSERRELVAAEKREREERRATQPSKRRRKEPSGEP